MLGRIGLALEKDLNCGLIAHYFREVQPTLAVEKVRLPRLTNSCAIIVCDDHPDVLASQSLSGADAGFGTDFRDAADSTGSRDLQGNLSALRPQRCLGPVSGSLVRTGLPSNIGIAPRGSLFVQFCLNLVYDTYRTVGCVHLSPLHQMSPVYLCGVIAQGTDGTAFGYRLSEGDAVQRGGSDVVQRAGCDGGSAGPRCSEASCHRRGLLDCDLCLARFCLRHVDNTGGDGRICWTCASGLLTTMQLHGDAVQRGGSDVPM